MTLGGTQRVTFNLIQWLNNNTDVSVHLIISSICEKGKEIYDLSDIPHSYATGTSLQRIKKTRRILKELKPDVLVTMDTPGAMFDVPACVGLGIKHIISERNDPSHFAGSTITRILSRLLMRKADGYVFQTKGAQTFYGGAIAKRSVIIPNPLLDLRNMPSLQYQGVDSKTIVTTGRLNKQKNHSLLVRAFKQIITKGRKYRLVIYGDGPERANDETLIKTLGLEDLVQMPGTINDVPSAIYKASVYVLSSDFEGMPNALMEAMALGLPCVSTDCPCGGPKELIQNKKNGILVPPGDENALAQALEYMIDNPKEAKEMGNEAMKIRESLNQNAICTLWYNYINDMTK